MRSAVSAVVIFSCGRPVILLIDANVNVVGAIDVLPMSTTGSSAPVNCRPFQVPITANEKVCPVTYGDGKVAPTLSVAPAGAGVGDGCSYTPIVPVVVRIASCHSRFCGTGKSGRSNCTGGVPSG